VLFATLNERGIIMKNIFLAGVSAIIMLSASHASAQNLVTNPDFLSGSTGWSLTPATSGSGFYFNFPYAGANFGAVGAYNDVLSQVLATTPGTLYKIAFDLQHWATNNANEFSASFGVNTIYSIVSASAFGAATITATATANSSSTTLAFAGREAPNWYILSNVSVTATAVPGPIAGAGLPALVSLLGFGFFYRRQRSLSV
jgi:hypothetical protein